MRGEVLAPVSVGDLVDRLCILHLKVDKAKGTALANVEKEMAVLDEQFSSNLGKEDADRIHSECVELYHINLEIWEAENILRQIEQAGGPFDSTFITTARSIYLLNDQRAAIKRRINIKVESRIIEEKIYA